MNSFAGYHGHTNLSRFVLLLGTNFRYRLKVFGLSHFRCVVACFCLPSIRVTIPSVVSLTITNAKGL